MEAMPVHAAVGRTNRPTQTESHTQVFRGYATPIVALTVDHTLNIE